MSEADRDWEDHVLNFWENVHKRGSNVHIGNTQAKDYADYFSQAGPFPQDLDRASGVLDVGPGFGRFLDALMSAGGVQCYAIEISKLGRERLLKRGVYAYAPGAAGAGVADLATCLSVIQHCELDAVELIFADVSRALRSGGRFYLNGVRGGHHTPGREALLHAGRCSHSLESMRELAGKFGFSVAGEHSYNAGALGVWILCLEKA